MTEEVSLERFNCFVTHTPYNVSVMKPFIPFNGVKRGANFNAKLAWRGAIQGIRALNRMKGTLGTKLRPDLILITGHDKGNMQVRNVDTGVVQKSGLHYNSVRVVNCVVTNSYIYTSTEKDLLRGKHGDDSTVYVWDLNSMKIIERMEGHDERVTSIAVCESDENKVVSGSVDRTAIVWNLKQEKSKFMVRLQGHGMMITKVLITGRTIYTASADATVRVWDIDGTPVSCFEGHSGPVLLMEWSIAPWEKKEGVSPILLTACGGGTVKEWSVAANGNLKIRWTSKPHQGQITDMCDDGPMVVTAGSDGVVSFYNRTTSNLIRITRPETANVRCIDLDFARKYLLLGTDNGNVVLWDYSQLFAGSTRDEDVRTLIVLAPHTSSISSIVLERDMKGKWERVITAGLDNTIFTLDFVTDRDSATFPLSVGKDLVQLPTTGSVITSLEQKAVVWDLTRQCRKDKPKDTLSGHSAPITAITYSVEVERLVTASEDQTVRAWDISLYSEEAMKNEELIESSETIQIGFPIKVMSNTNDVFVAVAGPKGARGGQVAIVDFAGSENPVTTFNLSYLPVKIAIPMKDHLLVQHRSGEVIHMRTDGQVLKTTPRDPTASDAPTFPLFDSFLATNWDPPHIEVVVADGRTVRCIDVTGDHVIWSATFPSTATAVQRVGQSSMHTAVCFESGVTVVIDSKGKTLFEILHDGNTVNVEAESSSLSSKRRRSLIDLSQSKKTAGAESAGPPAICALCVHVEARYIVVGYSDGVIVLWDMTSKKVVRRFFVPKAPTNISIFPKQHRMVVTMADQIRIDTLYPRTDQVSSS